MINCRLLLLTLLIVIFLGGCVQQPYKFPPVTEGWHRLAAAKNAYIVQKQDTLYSIAWAFDVDYHHLAAINNLSPPYKLHHGQRLYLASSAKPGKYYVQSKTKVKFGHDVIVTPTKPLLGWVWPTAGKIISTFNNKLGGNKGVNIAGKQNQAVLACNSGVVVYSGTGIRSYGKLLIIKHNEEYLSAYAHNQEMLVTEGKMVTTGQKIATMGRDNDGRVALHFEIRRFGKPIDPLLYLPKNHDHR